MNPTTQNNIVEKFKEYRHDLKQITEGLVQQAKAQNREDYTPNGLLREYYELVGKKLQTFDQWNEQNCSIIKGEHAYHFWDKPKTTADGKSYCPIAFLFSQDQVRVNAVQAAA